MLVFLGMRAGIDDLMLLRAVLGVCAALGILTWVDWASACPNCAVGDRVRALFWNDGFVANVLVVLVPFLVVAVVSVRADAIRRPADSDSMIAPVETQENPR